MKVHFELRWLLERSGAGTFDSRVFTLIRGIRSDGSLRAAARLAGISYRHAWNLVHEYGDVLGGR